MTNGYSQTATGALQVELASLTSVATLATGGTASLNGTLGVLLGGGYMPAASDVFTILDAASLSGAFANVDNSQRSTPLAPKAHSWSLTTEAQAPSSSPIS